MMGGHATIILVDGTPDLLDSAFALADRCEALWSRFLPTSDISRLNWAEGEAVEVDPLTIRLLQAMRAGSEVTGGDFDPTLLPNVIATGYATSTVAPDLTTTLPRSARAPGDLDGITVDGLRMRMPVGTTLDAGGIGKGLAADIVCEHVLDRGARGVMVEVSGDIVVAGDAPDGVAWRLGVEDPFEPSRHVTTLRMVRGAVVTSSQRKRRFSTSDDVRHHLIDPTTGLSARTGIQTVTVIAAAGARAEALAKSGFVRPPADYLAWLPEVGAAGLVIDAHGEQLTSTNWELYA